MKVHHLNCATFCPVGGMIPGAVKRLVCHCLLVESDQGLILVDTGLGLKDLAKEEGRLPEMFLKTGRPALDEKETAIRQIERLGFKQADLKHIVLTHLDLDHAGGLADFPDAQVHVYRPEYEAATQTRALTVDPKTAAASVQAHMRYRPAQWQHGPRWRFYSTFGEKWNGFDAVHELMGLPDGILMIPLIGHTHGHCGIAVKTPDGWLLHAGDSYFYHGEIDPVRPRCPRVLDMLQKFMEVDRDARQENQRKLRELNREAGGLRIFCAHDPEEFGKFSV